MMPFFNRFIFCCITLGGYCQLSTGQIVELSNNIWSININTDTLEMSAQPKKSSRTILNYPTIKDLSTHVKANKNKVSWQLSKYKLALSLELKKEDLFLKIISNKNQPLTIFKYSPDTNHIGYILPISEGLYFPDDDQTWQEIILSNHQKGDTTSSLSMPLISIVKKDYLLNYIFINPYNNEYSWSKSNNHLELLFIHNFNSLEPYLPFELLINLSENNDLLSG
ncbi:MAG: hypothetical protein HRT87_08645, partial [Legionellales bacterium]|nr:hypothetical protein [Legionellales bacterium]